MFRIRIHLGTDPNPAFFVEYGTDPDPIRIQGFEQKYKKFTAENKSNFFGSKITIYLFLGLHKGRPS